MKNHHLLIINEQCKAGRFLFLLLLIVSFSLFLISCDILNSTKQDDYLEKIDAEIAWANAAKLTVRIEYNPIWGTSNPPQGTVTPAMDIRQGYEFSVEFTPTQEYSLTGWKAYRSPLPKDWWLESDYISFLAGNAQELDEVSISVFSTVRGAAAKFTINTREPVTLVPLCKTQPYVIRTEPRNDPAVAWPNLTPIVIYFNAPLALPQDVLLTKLVTDKEELNTICVESRETGTDDPFENVNAHYNDKAFYNSQFGLHTITLTPNIANPPPTSHDFRLTVGPNIWNPQHTDKMIKVETFSWRTLAAGQTVTAAITDWGAAYDGNKIDGSVTYTASSEVEISACYRENRGGDTAVTLTSAGVPGIDKYIFSFVAGSPPDATGVKDGRPISGIREYWIFIEIRNPDTKLLIAEKDFRIWNFPEMSVNAAYPATEITSAAGDSDSSDGTLSFANMTLNSANVKYVLVNDIELKDTWTPVGTNTAGQQFRGKFYGNGKTITVSSLGVNGVYSGLFGYTSGTAEIRDLSIVYNVSVAGNSAIQNLGGVVASAAGSTTIRNIITGGSLTVGLNALADKNIGGIAGYMANAATIANCRVALDFNCTAGGSDATYFGGLVGQAQSGGLNTRTGISEIRITGNQSLMHSTNGLLFCGGGIGLFESGFIMNDVEFSGVLKIDSDDSNHASNIGGIIGRGGYQASTNLTLSNLRVTGSIEIPGTFSSYNDCHLGGLIGQIGGSNIQDSWVKGDINVSTRNSISIGGLVGTTASTMYENCRYEQGSIIVTGTGTLNLGGAFGQLSGAANSFTNCRSLAKIVSASRTGTIRVGGFLGYGTGGEVTGCYSTAEVCAEGSGLVCAGGLIGTMDNNKTSSAKISECFSTGNVTAAVTGGGNSTNIGAGGLIGYMFVSPGSVTNCYALGDVKAERSYNSVAVSVYAGGLVGYSSSTSIQYCFAKGAASVKCSGSGITYYAGGFVGDMAGGNLDHNAALGTSVTVMYNAIPADTTVGRIYGNASATTVRNYARANMFLGKALYTNNPYPVFQDAGNAGNPRPINDAEDRDGESVAFDSFMNSAAASPWIDDSKLNFDSQQSAVALWPGQPRTIWDFSNISRGYPTLAHLGGQ